MTADTADVVPFPTPPAVDLDDYPARVPDPDTVMSDEVAAQLVHALWALRRRIARKEATAAAALAAETARVNAWLEDQTGRSRVEADAIQARLEEWALDVRDASGGRRKSVSFPHGRVVTRESGGGWEVTDRAALLAWAKTYRPGLVETVESVSIAAARRVTSGLAVAVDEVVDAATGEVVPGLSVAPKLVKASVTVDGAS